MPRFGGWVAVGATIVPERTTESIPSIQQEMCLDADRGNDAMRDAVIDPLDVRDRGTARPGRAMRSPYA
jgi:hypothetical protein